MSVDVLGPNEQLRPSGGGCENALTGRERKEITDFVAIFGGWGGPAKGGGLLNPDENSDTAELLRRVQGISASPGRKLLVLGQQGALMFGNNAPLDALRSIFHPCMKIILYGYSVGGDNANTLAWQVWQTLTYYEFETGQFYSYLGADTARKSKIGITRVDLLITVDSAAGPGSNALFRNVAPSVRRNVNLYQTNPAMDSNVSGTKTGVLSHGGASVALWPKATLVQNKDVTYKFADNPAGAHGAIDKETKDEAYQLILDELRR